MSLGLFDVVGPIMHGPSSNHTAGANRIGYLARQIMGGAPRQLTFGFHPIFMGMFPGHRTHIAMLAGCLGLREYDEACNLSKQLADKEGITLAYRRGGSRPQHHADHRPGRRGGLAAQRHLGGRGQHRL